jgi:hypothetical protein
VREAQAFAIDGEALARRAPDQTGQGAGHGMTIAKDIQASRQLPDVGVRLFEFGEDLFGPDLARRVAQRRAALLRAQSSNSR